MKVTIECREGKYNGAEQEYAQTLYLGLKEFANRANCGGDIELWMKDDDILNKQIFGGHDVSIDVELIWRTK